MPCGAAAGMMGPLQHCRAAGGAHVWAARRCGEAAMPVASTSASTRASGISIVASGSSSPSLCARKACGHDEADCSPGGTCTHQCLWQEPVLQT
jgi:hypothetical protein